MPLYENVFLVRPDVSASQVEALTKEFSTIIEEGGGTVPKIEQWGLRTLAYRLKKNRKAHYVLMNLDAPTGAVHEMERNMRIHEDVLRHLTIRMEELEEGPSVIMQSKGSRDDRRDDRGGRSSRNEDSPRREASPPKEAAADNESESEGDKE
ncbi:MAG: 30S ribosomal protein S6 [Alphaproteobacteria bacterium]|nr:30S ribosomal protein S6 [Alphaproteobacteria bacterium]|tara:strand:- start:2551 stop:3006 length:456 start_codon:yes stop_codon:yes gene_type:complete